MDCAEVENELVAYHFGTLEAEGRLAIDEHLLGCVACLRAYQRVKHAFDAEGPAMARPSAAVRQRLRSDVLAAFAPRERPVAPREPAGRARVFALLSRPVPLYQTVAAACVAATVALAAASFGHKATSLPILAAPGPAQRIDSARPAFAGSTVF